MSSVVIVWLIVVALGLLTCFFFWANRPIVCKCNNNPLGPHNDPHCPWNE